MGDSIPYLLQSLTSSSSSVVLVGTLTEFLDQWGSITSNRIVFNMVKGHHLQLRYHLPSFHDIRQFNIKTGLAYHPIIQKEGDDLLAKATTEPSTGGHGFYSNAFFCF